MNDLLQDLNDQQRRAVESDNPLFCLKASAGTGKTTVIVNRFISLLERDRLELDQILALTFSRNAAAEMRERIKEGIERKLVSVTASNDSYWHFIYRKIDFARISTFHSFYADLLRSYPIEAGIDPEFVILDDDQMDDEITSIAYKNAISHISRENSDILNALTEITEISQLKTEYIIPLYENREKLHKLYDFGPIDPANPPLPTQEQINNLLNSIPKFVVTDFRWIGFEEELKDIRERLITSGKHNAAGTLLTQIDLILALSKDAREDEHQLPPENFINTISEAIKKPAKNSFDDEEFLQEISDLFADIKKFIKSAESLLKTDMVPLNIEMAEHLKNILYVYKAFEDSIDDYKRQNSFMDFTDLVLTARRLLFENPKVLRSVKGGLKHILVDEFQDTDHIQLDILMQLSGIARTESETGKPSRGKNSPGLFVVGDEKQSIYRFRGADVTVFSEIRRIFERLGGAIESLDENFRSSGDIVTFHNVLFPQFMPEKEIFDFEAAYQQALARKPVENKLSVEFLFKELQKREKNPLQDIDEIVSEYLSFKIKEADESRIESARRWEASQLALKIKKIVEEKTVFISDRKGKREPLYSDIALLFNAMTSFSIYERELISNSIPYRTIRSGDFLYRPEIMDIINLLSAVFQPYNDFYLASALRSPVFGINDETLLALKPEAGNRLWDNLRDHILSIDIDHEQAQRLKRASSIISELADAQDRFNLTDFISYCIDRLQLRQVYSGIIGHTERLHNIETFLDRDIAAWIGSGCNTLPALLKMIETRMASGYKVSKQTNSFPDEEEAGSPGSVLISTIHGAKGMEYPIVFIPDLGRQSSHKGKICIEHNLGIAVSYKVLTDENKRIDRKSQIYNCLAYLEDRKENSELKRLLYVAATRAEDYLVFSGAMNSSSAKIYLMMLSKFLPEGKFYKRLPESLRPVVLLKPEHLKAGKKIAESEDVFIRTPDLSGVKVDIRRVSPVQLSLKNKIRFIPSELPVYNLCPRLYYYEFVERLPEPDDSSKLSTLPMKARDFGSFIHKTLQLYDGEMPPDSEFDRLPLTTEQKDFVRNETARLLGNYKTTEIFKEAKSAEHIFKEKRFACLLKEYVLEGAMDLFLVDNGDCHIIDFKTDNIDSKGIDAKAAYYSQQLGAYAVAARKLTGLGEIECSIVFLNPGIVFSEKFDPKRIDGTEDLLINAFERIRSEKKWEMNQSACPCIYQKICSSSLTKKRDQDFGF